MKTPTIAQNLLNSEKFVYVTLLYMLPLTVFAAMGKITIQYWSDQALWAVGMLVFGKTVQGTAETIMSRKRPAADLLTTDADPEPGEITAPHKVHKRPTEPPPLPPAPTP